MTITNNNGGQTNTQVEAEAGHTEVLPEGTNATEDTENQKIEDRDQDDHGDQDGNDTDNDQVGARRNREAGLRRRAQAAEAERDQLRAQLDTLHRQIVTDIAVGEEKLPEVELLESAGHELASFITDKGEVDKVKVIEATRATMRRFNIPKHVGLTANPQQGMYHASVSSSGLDGVIKEALGR